VKRALAVLAVTLAALTACTSAADTASQNVSAAADNFEVNRRIVGINLRTGDTLFLVEGACSITRDVDLVVICKTGSNPDTFTKNYFGLGPNGGDGVTYVSTQLGPVQANQWRTRIILRPTTVLPDFDLQVGF
jgi:ABC-type Fe3+-hydroxamate transport system substrate-binding protein